MSHRFLVPNESHVRKHDICKQHADSNGLSDRCYIDSDEPKYLMMKRVLCVTEDEQAIHHECGRHAEQVSQHD